MIFKRFKPFLSGLLTLTFLHNRGKGRFILSTAVDAKFSVEKFGSSTAFSLCYENQ